MRDRSDLNAAIGLEALQAMTARARQRRPWLSSFCGVLDDEIRLLESRGVVGVSTGDLAADVGLLVLDMILEHEDENAAIGVWPSGQGADAAVEEQAWRK